MNEWDEVYLSRPKMSRGISGSWGLVSKKRIRPLRLLEAIFCRAKFIFFLSMSMMILV